MGGDLAGRIVELKRKLVESYGGNSPLYEAVPADPRGSLPIDAGDLEALHRFARNNPLYSRSREADVGGVRCIVYEGDPNDSWLDSLKHDASCAPFYTTWILSAYALAREARGMGIRRAIDAGSGDGRIAYCCGLLGMRSLGIEIDDGLVETQRRISSRTGVGFESVTGDAARFDYSALPPEPAVFFIGGLPEMGEMLAESVVSKVASRSRVRSTFVLTGAGAARGLRYGDLWGWSDLIRSHGLHVEAVLTLPTRWTMDQPFETPYVFASLTKNAADGQAGEGRTTGPGATPPAADAISCSAVRHPRPGPPSTVIARRRISKTRLRNALRQGGRET